jgi:hypothetical protein
MSIPFPQSIGKCICHPGSQAFICDSMRHETSARSQCAARWNPKGLKISNNGTRRFPLEGRIETTSERVNTSQSLTPESPDHSCEINVKCLLSSRSIPFSDTATTFQIHFLTIWKFLTPGTSSLVQGDVRVNGVIFPQKFKGREIWSDGARHL